MKLWKSPGPMNEDSAGKRLDCLPGGRLKIWQDRQEFCFTTDAVFLAAFPHLVTKARVLELGCGTGAVSLLMASRGASQVLSVDINPHVVALLQESLRENRLEERVEARCADIRNYRELFRSESFDLVLANPPYRVGGRRRQVGTEACHETGTTLEDFFRAASFALKTRGRFVLVQIPERFTDAVKLGMACQLELKRLQWVHARSDRPAWIFLAEFTKGGHPGLEVLPPLVMYNPDGSYSRQTLEYYYGKEHGHD